MNGNNKSGNKFLSAALTPKSIAILLVFSFMVTVLAFGVAYNEHQKNVNDIEAAKEALSGVSNVGDLTHFRTVNGREGLIIGNHVFY